MTCALRVASKPWNVVTRGIPSCLASPSAETPSMPKCAWISAGRCCEINYRQLPLVLPVEPVEPLSSPVFDEPVELSSDRF